MSDQKATQEKYLCITPDVKLGKDVKLSQFINLYGCEIGDETKIGAFVEILPGTDGLVHISQLAPGRVNKVTDILKEGDEVMVKVLEIDRQGKIRLSRKEALQETGGGAAVSNAPA